MISGMIVVGYNCILISMSNFIEMFYICIQAFLYWHCLGPVHGTSIVNRADICMCMLGKGIGH